MNGEAIAEQWELHLLAQDLERFIDRNAHAFPNDVLALKQTLFLINRAIDRLERKCIEPDPSD